MEIHQNEAQAVMGQISPATRNVTRKVQPDPGSLLDPDILVHGRSMLVELDIGGLR